jgi:hypothetical protein
MAQRYETITLLLRKTLVQQGGGELPGGWGLSL